MFQYWGFGLNIESEIEFPEFLPSNFTTPDVTIILGETPKELEGDDVVHKVRVSASPSEYLLNLQNIARYYVANGKHIIIDPYPGIDLASIRLFMLSNAMAALLHQLNRIPFHASGIVTPKGLVLFTGHSGVGKSTTAYGLMQKGYQLFTDDVCVFNFNKNNDKIEASSSYPILKLWDNTINRLEADKTSASRLRPNLPKYGFAQHETFISSQIPVIHVFILKTNNLKDEFSCNDLTPVKAFNELQQNTYRRRQVDMMNLREPHFTIISQLTQQAKVSELLRFKDATNIPDFIHYIEQLIAPYGQA